MAQQLAHLTQPGAGSSLHRLAGRLSFGRVPFEQAVLDQRVEHSGVEHQADAHRNSVLRLAVDHFGHVDLGVFCHLLDALGDPMGQLIGRLPELLVPLQEPALLQGDQGLGHDLEHLGDVREAFLVLDHLSDPFRPEEPEGVPQNPDRHLLGSGIGLAHARQGIQGRRDQMGVGVEDRCLIGGAEGIPLGRELGQAYTGGFNGRNHLTGRKSLADGIEGAGHCLHRFRIGLGDFSADPAQELGLHPAYLTGRLGANRLSLLPEGGGGFGHGGHHSQRLFEGGLGIPDEIQGFLGNCSKQSLLCRVKPGRVDPVFPQGRVGPGDSPQGAAGHSDELEPILAGFAREA